MSGCHDIGTCTRNALRTYFQNLEGEAPSDVYEMVFRGVERAMLEVVLTYAEGNQSQAAEILGINRNTLRKKLLKYKLVG